MRRDNGNRQAAAAIWLVSSKVAEIIKEIRKERRLMQMRIRSCPNVADLEVTTQTFSHVPTAIREEPAERNDMPTIAPIAVMASTPSYPKTATMIKRLK
jgi:hypothetical protein